mgnify:CR=1 FL=1
MLECRQRLLVACGRRHSSSMIPKQKPMRYVLRTVMLATAALMACSKNEPAPAKTEQPVTPAPSAAPVAAPVQADPAAEAKGLFASRRHCLIVALPTVAVAQLEARRLPNASVAVTR